MNDELQRLSNICHRMEFYNEKPTLADLKELNIDLEGAIDCAHDDCFSESCVEDRIQYATEELESERDSLRLEVAALKEELTSKPKRRRKAKLAVDFDSLAETYNHAKIRYFECACDIDDKCIHARMKMTAERWLSRGKELAS